MLQYDPAYINTPFLIWTSCMVLSVSIVTGFDRYFYKGCYTKLEKKEEKTSLTYSLVNLTKSFEIVFCVVS